MLNFSDSFTTSFGISIDSAASRLTDTILGHSRQDLAHTLISIASELEIANIAYLRFTPTMSVDTSLLTATVTYSRLWQTRYFLKQYVKIDPVVARGKIAVIPFDWSALPVEDRVTRDFFADAARHGVGGNGLSIPVRNRRGMFALVSFTRDGSPAAWTSYTSMNIGKLQLLSVLIDSAANINSKLPADPVVLSRREEQCLIWAARGKTFQEIADILNLSFGSVKTYLDSARHKLHAMNLTHAVATAIATGLIPAKAMK